MVGVVVFLCIPHITSAATLSVVSSANSVVEGNLFTIRVVVNTQEKFINNAEAVINYPPELVEAVSIHSNQSIFSLWAENPSFSNASGVISFNGGVVNPGFNGGGGEIFSATFRAKKAGTASFIISGAAVRENDGLGTDILSGRKSVTLEIVPVVVPEVPEKEEPSTPVDEPAVEDVPQPTLLGAAVISSPTHPNQNIWYVSKNVILNWKVPADASALQTLLSRDPNAVPTTPTSLGTTSRTITDVADGVWYFNIRYQKNNVWSKIVSYKLQIDSVAPTDLSIESHTDENGYSTLSVQATDLISGIDYYEILQNGAVLLKIENESLGDMITLPLLSTGEQVFKIRVYDIAKNVTEKEVIFSVVPVVSPRITYIQDTVLLGDRIYARGSTPYQNASVVITVKSPDGKIETYSVNTDTEGNFAFSSEPASSAGIHELWSHIMGEQGETGPVSEHFQILVETHGPTFGQKMVGAFLNVKSLALVSALLFLIACFGWYKYFALQKLVHVYLEKERKRINEASVRAIQNKKRIVSRPSSSKK